MQKPLREDVIFRLEAVLKIEDETSITCFLSSNQVASFLMNFMSKNDKLIQIDEAKRTKSFEMSSCLEASRTTSCTTALEP